MAPNPLQQGDPAQIGRYRLTARLGAGGMGVVYLADAGDGRQVAVKVLRPEYADDGEFRARFQREVAAMARVRNRYTVQVLDADTDSAMPFLATEFADGPSLDEHVKARGPLHPEATIRLAAALAEALAAIHAAGVTHRDLKPSNVLLTGRGPMVIDFGIAQVADTVSITRTGMAIGSPGYMAPEQITGNAGREADIFTWALMVAFAASGQPPFGTGPTVTILHRILNDSPDVSAVPPRLMPLVRAAIAKDPQRRPPAADLLRELSPGSAATMAMAAQTVADGRMARGVRENGFEGFAGREQARTRALSAEPGPRRRWRGAVVAAAVVVVLAGAGAGAALLANGGSHPGTSTPGGGGSPSPSATGPALSGTTTGGGSVTQTGAPKTQPTAGQQAPPGQAKKKQGNGNGNGGPGDGGTGGKGGGTFPTPTPSPTPSASVSPTPAPSVTPSAGGGIAPVPPIASSTFPASPSSAGG